jgi:gluconolactonase
MKYLLALFVVAWALSAEAQAQNKPIPGIGPAGKIKKLHTGFKFTEGPAADSKGNVYFSDIPNATIHKVDAGGKLSVWTDKSNRTNGMMLNADGEIIACQMGAGQVVAYNPKTKKFRVLADKYKGKSFNAPNDLVIDKTGGVYFTDPDFGVKKPPQDKLSVYYIPKSGKVRRVIEHLPKPNGVILSPDEKTLYVIPSFSSKMMAYPVKGPGKLGKGRVFCELKQPKGVKNRGGDGLTVDTKGNLYITSRLGLQVFSPKGKLLGIIELPEVPANVTFGGPDNKTLYVTARTSLYVVPMQATGHVFAKK